ncbi:outer membrane beta-barrel protein [Sphingobacterium sp. DN00404]|uniref:Outer membrane beta-barrel protein n=1 Tax=Sphingobacterium micropteri TaxID=2763501 RepID=A0ABR7YQ04_9SPHI|nr:outer membrane beta-barrel protein [Sphingobacterium micropteri]MBD1433424.1 outer membrane beta-barrel protein [Sphingobacterium micropteri]
MLKSDKAKTFRLLVLTLLFLTSLSEGFSQVGVGVKVGGNLSDADALSFRSSKRLGFQVGMAVSYHFRPNMAIQAEPTFNLTRIRANSETVHETKGIDKGNKALHFFDLPVLFRLDVTSGFALLGGVEFNSLLNADRYRLNNSDQAFKSGIRLGYTVGLELGKFYFRYRGFERSTEVHRSWTTAIQQYQVGVKWNIR